MTLNSLGHIQTPIDILILTAQVQDQTKKDNVWQGLVKSLKTFISSQNNQIKNNLHNELNHVHTKMDKIQDEIKELKQMIIA